MNWAANALKWYNVSCIVSLKALRNVFEIVKERVKIFTSTDSRQWRSADNRKAAFAWNCFVIIFIFNICAINMFICWFFSSYYYSYANCNRSINYQQNPADMSFELIICLILLWNVVTVLRGASIIEHWFLPTAGKKFSYSY